MLLENQIQNMSKILGKTKKKCNKLFAFSGIGGGVVFCACVCWILFDWFSLCTFVLCVVVLLCGGEALRY